MATAEVEHVVTYIDGVIGRAALRYGADNKDVNLGMAVLQGLAEHPTLVGQIDAVTNASWTFEETRHRVILLSLSLSRAGLSPGDNVLLVAPNTLHTCLPLYASLLNGLPLLPIDYASVKREIDRYVAKSRPKIVFCVQINEGIVKQSLKNNNVDCTVIVLDNPGCDIEAFVEKQKVTSADVDSFAPPKFNLSTPAWLVPTSGTTGQPKVAIMTHRNLLHCLPYFFYYFKEFPKPTKSTFLLSTPQWITGLFQYSASALFAFTRIQTSTPPVLELCQKVFEKYKPTFLIVTPTKLLEIFNGGKCNMSCIETMLIGGSALSESLEKSFRARYPNISYFTAYGMTELFGICVVSDGNGPSVNVGKEFSDGFQYKLVDPMTGRHITEPNVTGELWVKNDSKFEGYYNDLVETANIYSEDGYLKTGDLLYKDADGYYFFVERMKMLLKYKSFQVYPTEIEEVLRTHPAVADVGVTGQADVEGGEVPVALVVLENGLEVTPFELQELVGRELSDPNRLRGGVYFVDSLPLTPSHKINRPKLRNIAKKLGNNI